jgi:hypothetical protein
MACQVIAKRFASAKNRAAASVVVLQFKTVYLCIKMPEICTFYGLVILMNYRDHSPPHFHVWYGEYKAMVTILDGIVKGEMPQRALKMVFD